MKQRIRELLIKLANWIGGNQSYDFGEPIQYLMEHKGYLIVATKGHLYKTKDNVKFTKIRGIGCKKFPTKEVL